VVFDAVVVAGGAGSRMGSGSADKAGLKVGGVTLLDRVLAAVAGAGQIVVVGPRRPIVAATTGDVTVTFTTEESPGSGPAAALVHGLAFVSAPLVVVLAADVPFAATAVPRLIDAIMARAGADAAMIVDQAGRRQPLLAIYRTGALLRAAASDRWIDRSLRALTDVLAVIEVEAVGVEALDCDTPEQLATARAHAEPAAPAATDSATEGATEGATEAEPMTPPTG
jgi:molybdopterin-guanine dinucleotide biosynthesis protein A